MAAADILGLLARTNLAAAAAIILVVVLRRSARPLFGARLVYGLWLLPVLAAAAVMAPARVMVEAAPPASAEEALAPLLAGPAGSKLPIAAAAHATADPASLLLALWLVGVIAAAVAMAGLQRRFAAEVRKGAIGPAVVGVVAPRIVTPADFEQKFNVEEQVLVLAHERAHIARQDSRLNGLSAAIQCVCWFNPLVHLAAHLMRIDQEMACDETVVTRFPEARRAYAQALVKAQLAIRPLPLGCYWPSGSEHPLLERITLLKQNQFSRSRRLAGGAGLAVLCAATGFAAWASQPAQVRIEAAQVSSSAPVMAAATPSPTPAPELRRAAPQPDTREPDSVVSEKLARLALATTSPPQARLAPIAPADPSRGGAPAVSPAPAAGAGSPTPNITEAQRTTSRDYLECQRTVVKAVDDGKATEDAVATEIGRRCETQYQAYRQASVANPGSAGPAETGWILDNGRQERARLFVHAARRANAMMADIASCVRGVADQFSAESFDQQVDRAAQRCGALVPFPVAPVEHRTASTPSAASAADGNHEQGIRLAMTVELRKAIKARSQQP